ncbi:uncharacterized protein LOC107303708 [Oryza brachyantha]|uniref:F-box domain-containing protein n=1 Tax=Oryza brachyantha TaxID=4533 RepID=J3LIL9_ORYBR|nr:uncharacterized protein LOC107303708 [Oryza brachyantha]
MKRKKGRRRPRKKKSAVNLSELPNDVLLDILERVDTPDAVRTCFLSRNMATLPRLLSRVAVDVDSFASRDDSLPQRDLVRRNGAVADAVNTVLASRDPRCCLHEIKLRFYLKFYDCLSIGKAVAQAMSEHKIDIIEFTILTEKGSLECTSDDRFYYLKQFNSFLGACPTVFAGLTRLDLQNLWFGESDIPNILLTCEKLESLRLYSCKAADESVLRVEHPHLVELQIAYGNFETVQLVDLPKLQRMTCQTWISYQDPLVFGHTPCLSNLSLTDISMSWQGNLRLSSFLANAPTIQVLNLNFRSEKIWVVPESSKLLLPVLSQLQSITLVDLPEGCDIAWTMFILEAAPNLKELSITVRDHWCTMVRGKEERELHGYCKKANVEWEPSVANLKHENLAKLTISGFQPNENFVGYIRRVMEAASNLKQIFLHDRNVDKCCAHLDPEIVKEVTPSRYPRTMEEQELLKKEMTERLESEGMDLSDVVHFQS